MNIEDKYKSVFTGHQSEIDPALWNKIEQKLDDTSSPIKWWWLAASITLGILLYQFNFNQGAEREFAQEIILPKIETKPLEYALSSSRIHKSKNTVQTDKSFLEEHASITLNKISINKIDPIKPNQHLIHSRVTLVQVKIGTSKTSTRTIADNPIEGVIELAIHFFRQKKKDLNLPTIEIDYNSLLTLNQES